MPRLVDPKRLAAIAVLLMALIGATTGYGVLGIALQPLPAPALAPTSVAPRALTQHIRPISPGGLGDGGRLKGSGRRYPHPAPC